MSDACTALGSEAGFVSSMVGYVDCQTQVLGSGAWTALAAPGSTLAIVLIGFLTIFIALIGYNLLLGRSISVREGTLAFVKIGAVFALATSWPAYRTLIYAVVTNGPSQLVAEIGPQARVVGSDGTLLQRLDLVDQSLSQLSILGAGPAPIGVQLGPPPFVGFDAFALGGSRILFLLTAIGGVVAVRIVTGLMLALGPFFIAFLMFDSTRSFFEGWIRVLAGAALGMIGVSIALGLELALMEPWISGVLARRMAGEALPTMPSELFVLTSLFTIIIIASLYGCARVARAFRLPAVGNHVCSGSEAPRTLHTRVPASEVATTARATALEGERSRAAVIASALASIHGREATSTITEVRMAFDSSRPSIIAARSGEAPPTLVPIGRTFARRAVNRVSAVAMKRDASA